MGCDIHGGIEFREGDRWETFAIVHIDRNYRLFAEMAGVRNHGPMEVVPVAPDRGVPSDMSGWLRAAHDDDDGHSETWLTSEEFAIAIERSGATDPAVKAALAAMAALDACGFPARLVVWFDN